MKYILLISLCLGIGIGCNQGLDIASQVKDLRILGIVANPPEIHANAITQWDSPHVSFEALVVHPDKKPVNYTWQFCAAESSQGCTDLQSLLPPWQEDFVDFGFFCGLVIAHTDGPIFPEPLTEERWNTILTHIEDLYATEQSGIADAVVSEPATLRYAIPSFEVTLFEDLALFHCMSDILGTTVGWWPSAILTVSDDEKSIVAQKRVTLSINDLATDQKGEFFAEIFGAPICTDEITTECVPYKNSGTKENSLNVNPEIEVIQKGEDDLATSPFCDLTGNVITNDCELELPLKTEVKKPFRIKPVMTKESTQFYQVIETSIAERKLIVSDRKEMASISWFVTDGTIQEELTWPKFTKTLDTVFTPPKEVSTKHDGLIWVWMVARDQRGGLTWYELPLTMN